MSYSLFVPTQLADGLTQENLKQQVAKIPMQRLSEVSFESILKRRYQKRAGRYG
ncbi:MAG: hypothetical protein QOD99_426 [Chthoniobacter sp.]|nr:hypothetical protein [Chthoniobacter sp.]